MDTICAIATARACAAIGIIRVSGERAFEICNKIIRLKNGNIISAKSAQMRLGYVHDGNADIDQVMCVSFRSPASYTGEDMVEINCHGSVMILNRIMKLLIKNGARSAQAGEFTKRAFLNGKLDLIQAEAVGDLIDAYNQTDAALALSHMSGGLSDEFNEIFNRLIDINTNILAYIDFPDEGLVDVDPCLMIDSLNKILKSLRSLAESFEIGSVIHDGADTAIVGAPNVGKSTLLNAILGYERSIVSKTEGTTRDMISERVTMGGVTLNLCDTAGIRKMAGEIEKRGIEITCRTLKNADLVFAVFDASRSLSDDDKKIIQLCKGKTAVAVLNKCDLTQTIDKKYIRDNFIHIVEISAEQKQGLEKLSEIINKLFLSDKVAIESGTVITNVRHYERAVKASEYVQAAINTLESGFTPDVASVDITEAASQIGMITGASVSDKIIDEIFSKFCVGK